MVSLALQLSMRKLDRGILAACGISRSDCYLLWLPGIAPQHSHAPAAGGFNSAVDNYESLLTLARTQGAVGGANRGACKKCGQLGHLTKQCRNDQSLFFGQGGSDQATPAGVSLEKPPQPPDAEGDLSSLSSDLSSSSDGSSSSGDSSSSGERRKKRKHRHKSGKKSKHKKSEKTRKKHKRHKSSKH